MTTGHHLPIIVLACGRFKADRPMPAAQLYTGDYARSLMAWARSVVPVSHIFYLSARHGLIRPTTVLSPYDARLGHDATLDPDHIRQQAQRLDLLDRDVIALCGVHYATLVRQVWPTAVCPFQAIPNAFVNRQRQLVNVNRGRLPADWLVPIFTARRYHNRSVYRARVV
jgi:hypothetical protein